MARKRTFTDRQIRRVHLESANVHAMAAKLGVSIITVYKHMKRLDLKPPSDTGLNNELTRKIFNAYRGSKVIADLAETFGVKESTIRYHLSMGIAQHWSKGEVRIVPPPGKLLHIKLVHELEGDESMFDKPQVLSNRTGIPLTQIVRYLESVFEHHSTKGN